MSELLVSGGTPLEGELTVHGAKNSVLPILAACLLTREQVTIHNCPRLTDVAAALYRPVGRWGADAGPLRR